MPIRRSTSARSTSENTGPSATTRRHQQVECRPHVAGAHERSGLSDERLHLQLRHSRGADLGTDGAEHLEGLVGLIRKRQRLGTCQRRLGLPARVRRNTDSEVVAVDSEPLREPDDRVTGRARLPALDLAHVLLREAVAASPLRQPGREPQRPQPVAESEAGTARVCSCGGRHGFHSQRDLGPGTALPHTGDPRRAE